MIIKSAILYNGQVFIGKRHPEIMQIIRGLFPDSYIKQDMQGFFTDQGEFLNREKAREHAITCNQINKNFNKVLTSEDLW